MRYLKVGSLVLGVWIAAAAGFAHAQAYPTKTVRIVVPYPPGGGNDVMARIFAQKLSESMGQQFIVENRPGAGTIIGTAYVAKQAVPDGYTILLSSIATHAFAPFLYAKPGYDALRDFVPITNLAISPTIVAVNPSLPVRSLKELLALARARPGQLSLATAGTGSASHMLGETFRSVTGIKVVEIPYKGGGPSHIGMITGEAQLIADPAASIMPHVKSNRLRALAVARNERLPDLPNVPTFKEAGLPQYTASAWYSMHAPAKTPPEIVVRLNKELVRLINTPEVKEKLKDLGSDGVGNSPEEFGQFVISEHTRYGKLIKEMGVKPE
jgi:tripartite-type tricarboxylate transporter receptor subunit TctC